MIELWFIWAIGVLYLVSTIISSKGSLFDKRFIWYKRLTKRGQIVSLIGLTIIVLSILQFTIVKGKEDRKEISQTQQRRISDSIISSEINKGVDANRKQLFKDLSESFAKQNLKLDTVTKNIERLRDSAKTVILNSPREYPIIIIRDHGITHIQKNDTLEFTLSLISTQAASSIIYLDYLCEVNYTDGSQDNTKVNRLITGDLLIPKEQALIKTFNLYTNKKYPNKKIHWINIALIGKYTQTESNKEIMLRDVYSYSFITKNVTFLMPDEKKLFFGKYNI